MMKTWGIWIAVVLVVALGVWLYNTSVDSSSGTEFKKINDVVYNNPQTGAVWQVVDSIKAKLLKDPDSYTSVKWYQVQKRSDGNFEVRHRFGSKNDKGETMDPVTLVFILDPSGSVIDCHQ